MLWAIDVGNTHTVVGLWNGASWAHTWRLDTDSGRTEDQLAATLKTMCDLVGVPFAAQGVVIASVVPQADFALQHLAQKWLGCEPVFLRNGAQVGIEVLYEPAHAVGADRIANALAAIELGAVPAVIVDFGTATTFDAIDAKGRYLGGAILPGLTVSLEALVGRTAKLPQVPIEAPERAIGRHTVEALQSGLVLGYAGAIDALAARICAELGGEPAIIATGGLAPALRPVCASLQRVEKYLTLDGLRLAYRILASAKGS